MYIPFYKYISHHFPGSNPPPTLHRPYSQQPRHGTALVQEVPHKAQRARGDEETVEDAVGDEVIGFAPGQGMGGQGDGLRATSPGLRLTMVYGRYNELVNENDNDYQWLIWLVVDLPLWQIWLRQLGLWNSQYVEK